MQILFLSLAGELGERNNKKDQKDFPLMQPKRMNLYKDREIKSRWECI